MTTAANKNGPSGETAPDASSAQAATTSGRAVLVTTDNRGVFFGYVVDDSKLPAQITLAQARCAVRWRNGRGFLGLASLGPQEGSRISPAAPQAVFYRVTSVSDCSPESVTQWERGRWG